VSQAELAAGGGVQKRPIGAAVVGHDALDADAVAGEEVDRPPEEAGRRDCLLVDQHLGVGEAAVVVDRDVDELPAGVADAAAIGGVGVGGLAAPVAGDAMAGAQDSAELLDVDVDELARAPALVAVRRLGRLELRRLPSPTRLRTAETVDRAMASASAIWAAVIRRRRRRTISVTRSAGVLCGIRCGAEERSSSPGSPSARQRFSQRRALRSLIPAAAAASSSDQPASIRSTSSFRLFGQVRALPWSFIRCPPWDWWR
jgi:hypothetical protein